MRSILALFLTGITLAGLDAQLPVISLPQPASRPVPDRSLNKPQALVAPLPNPALTPPQAVEIAASQPAPAVAAEADAEDATLRFAFPDQAARPGARYYREAMDELCAMLDGRKPADLKRAVFLCENAWYENRLSYESFCGALQLSVDVVQQSLRQEGYSPDNDLAKKYALHQYFFDTIGLQDEQGRLLTRHLPFRYDFQDIDGKQDWSKMFVTKLLSTGSGQCHSFPLLYLMLARELGLEAWLAYSPQHSYVRLRDDKQVWYNLEMSNGRYASDSWVLASGFIKAAALKNRIFMDTLSDRETVAACLVDLGKGYMRKYGLDSLVLSCAEKTLEYHPANIYALQLKADYYTHLFDYILEQLKYPPRTELALIPEAEKVYLQRNAIYDQIDGLGYEPIPESVYQAWLRSFEAEKNKKPLQPARP